jgi:hypothetical protein
MYRFIEIKSNGNLLVEHVSTMQLAYRLCVPADLGRWHLKMLPAVRDEAAQRDLILVSYDDQPDSETGLFTACYIQATPRGPNTPYPQLPRPNGQQPPSDEILGQPPQIPSDE